MARKGKKASMRGKGWHGDKKGHSKASKKGWQTRKMGYSVYSMTEMRKIHKARPQRAQTLDNRHTKPRVIEPGSVDTELWVRNPQRYDVRGIDTRPPGRPKKANKAPAKAKTRAKPKKSRKSSAKASSGKKKQWRF